VVFVMGGTLPAAARAVESDGDAARRRLALVYGLNTLARWRARWWGRSSASSSSAPA
jgi:hypothetical protein